MSGLGYSTVRVDVASRQYDVRIGRGLADRAADHIAPLLKRPRTVIVMDDIVSGLHGPRLIGALEAGGISVETVIVPPGEGAKSFAGLEGLLSALLDLELDRGDVIVAYGGGVVGDLAGFAAAVYKRGIDFIQVPTTLLAQVDSSVGGKTAIDAPQGKNLIGAFHQPRLVLADLAVLDTLPDRELRCGYAEVLKYGLLGDLALFEWLEANCAPVLARDDVALAHAVKRSVELKAEIVAEDERENGRRALLNLGHTFAHALEAETGFNDRLKHGEAVGLGCALAFRFSVALGHCAGQEAVRASRAVVASGLPSSLADIGADAYAADALVHQMAQDKKAAGGQLTFILARRLGDAFVQTGIEPEQVRRFLIGEGAQP